VPDRTKVPPGRRKSRWRIREVTSKIVGGGSGRRYREGNAIGKSADIGTLHATATTSEVCVTVAQSCESEAQGVQSQFGCWNVLPLQGCVACKEVAPRCLLVRSMALHHSPLRGTRLYASEDNQFNGHSGVKIQRTPLLADLRRCARRRQAQRLTQLLANGLLLRPSRTPPEGSCSLRAVGHVASTVRASCSERKDGARPL
jgi:hypothetical protein